MDSFSWDDVRGKLIVGARKGGVPQMVLEWLLRANGIEPFRDVGIITHWSSRRPPAPSRAAWGTTWPSLTRP